MHKIVFLYVYHMCVCECDYTASISEPLEASEGLSTEDDDEDEESGMVRGVIYCTVPNVIAGWLCSIFISAGILGTRGNCE